VADWCTPKTGDQKEENNIATCFVVSVNVLPKADCRTNKVDEIY
jgi:hypothetical protein